LKRIAWGITYVETSSYGALTKMLPLRLNYNINMHSTLKPQTKSKTTGIFESNKKKFTEIGQKMTKWRKKQRAGKRHVVLL
jgi:hypothetical protein